MKGDSAQERADRIKARRQAEGTFDARPLGLVPSPTCGHFRHGWVCTSVAHPQAPEQHYFVKKRAL